MSPTHRQRIQSAWEGRVSGCILGKPVELLSMQRGHAALSGYLERAGALPLRDYVPFERDDSVPLQQGCCRGHIRRAEADDDINYTVLALLMLEEQGLDLTTEAVARSWLRLLPAGWVFTAELAAYKVLLAHAADFFALGAPPGFDLAECSDNEWNEWIGAQIRADLYGWVCPGQPDRAAALARRDAGLSHRGDGVEGAAFVAACGAAIAASETLGQAVETALAELPAGGAADAVRLGRSLAGDPNGGATIRERYAALSPVHTLNNLALVTWSLLTHPDDFGAAVGDVVAAGLDTDCNGATVGGLWGLQGKPVPASWTEPWQGRVTVTLAGQGELDLGDLVERTVALCERFGVARAG